MNGGKQYASHSYKFEMIPPTRYRCSALGMADETVGSSA